MLRTDHLPNSANISPPAERWAFFGVVLLAAAFLSGCGGTTYGTGQSAGLQTLSDFGAIPKDKSEIDYSARAPIVKPPVIGVLPPPGSGNQTASNADWPVDLDEQAREIKAQIAASEVSYTGPGTRSQDSSFNLPVTAVAPAPGRSNLTAAERARGSPEETERAKIAKAAFEAGGALDENGNPVRRYLTDPPAEYRIPDTESPMLTEEVIEDCEKFRFPWQNKPEVC